MCGAVDVAMEGAVEAGGFRSAIVIGVQVYDGYRLENVYKF